MSRYQLWIHDKDPQGQSLDPRILKAAKEIGSALTRYRGPEIDCESTANTILQSAVEAASHATRGGRVDNPPGYLTTAYKRLVDKFLDRRNRVVAVDDMFLEDLVNSRRVESPETVAHNRLVLRQLLDSMDPDTRRICHWRLEGYSVREIAKELGITPNCLSVRYARGVKRALRSVLEHAPDLRTNDGQAPDQTPGPDTSPGTGFRPPHSVPESGPSGLPRHASPRSHRNQETPDA